MRKLLLFLGIISSQGIFAQCVTISCTPSFSTPIDSNGSCGALVNYSLPTATSICVFDSAIFNYTGVIETFVVPQGIDSLTMVAMGAQGGDVNVSCTASGGKGAFMSGRFPVTPGDVLQILVGQQGLTNGADAGGGGGSYIVATGNVPLLIAGGGGGASNNIGQCGINLNGIDAVITQDGTASGDGIIPGGVGGQGGGASGGSGGGGAGWFSDGIPGNGLANNNGKSFMNGGAGGTGNNNDFGGFGGGGAGWFTGGNGGGGGGYSGGGTNGGQPFAGGGGAGSYNAGVSQINLPGFQTGNGQIRIYYGSNTATITQIAGLPGGSVFPIGVTTNTFVASDGIGNSDTCSFDITVIDNLPPVLTCAGNLTTCDSVVTGIGVTGVDSCSGIATITYQLSGATTGSGTGDASGSSFNPGTSQVVYTVTDSASNISTCSITVEVLNCLGEDGIKNLHAVKAFPNPVNENLTLDLGAVFEQVQVSLSSVSGQVLYTQQTTNASILQIPMANFSEGIYLLTIQNNTASKTIRVIKN